MTAEENNTGKKTVEWNLYKIMRQHWGTEKGEAAHEAPAYLNSNNSFWNSTTARHHESVREETEPRARIDSPLGYALS